MQTPDVNTSVDDTIKYFTQDKWGKHYESDKYWDDEVLFNNFIVFYCYAYAWLNLPRPTMNQLMIAKHVSNKENKHRLVSAMRGLAKSLTAQIYTVWRLFRDLDEHILVMSASGTRARNFTGFVKKLIRLLPCTSHMSPRHNQERTSGESFDVAGASDSDSPSVYAVGVENQIAGFRATLVIYDDIENKQNSSSVVQLEKINYYAKEALNLLIAGREETVTLCTPYTRDSIYIGWIREGFVPLIIPSEYVSKKHYFYPYIADYIKDKSEKFPSIIGKATDERINDKVLAEKKSLLGSTEYSLQYLIDVSESDESKYPLKLRDLIVTDVDFNHAPVKIFYSSMPDNIIYTKHNGFKTDRIYKESSRSEQVREYQVKLMSIDPSGAGSDETGYSVGYVLAGNIWIKENGGVGGGGYEDSTVDGLIDIAINNDVNFVVIEKNYGDGAFAKIFEQKLRKKSPNIGIVTIHNKGQKEVRIINALEPLMNQHKIIFDKQVLDRDIGSQKAYSLTYQLSHLTRERDSLRHDDRLESLAILASYAVENYFQYNEEVMMEEKKDSLSDVEDFLKNILGAEIANRNLNYTDNY